jgi:hypothetical protein
MNVIRKDATITPTGADTDFPGTFKVILSAPTKDRDGETLLPDEWKQPLPDRITFDADHGMSVASTVGSGVPSLNDAGELVVSGTFSSLPRAQEVRTLVKEGHINTTSVAFMSSRSPMKDGKQTITRELLNGAFVAIPSNREALVLSSKAAEVKLGARNSAKDMEHIQSIHDHASAMGADCGAPAKSARQAEVKAFVGSLEAAQERACDALEDAYAGPDVYVYLRATLPTTLVFEVMSMSDSETYQQDYTDDGTMVTLAGERRAVDVAEMVMPDPDEATEPAADVTAAAAADKSVTAAAVTKAAEDESIRLHAQSIATQASVDLTD